MLSTKCLIGSSVILFIWQISWNRHEHAWLIIQKKLANKRKTWDTIHRSKFGLWNENKTLQSIWFNLPDKGHPRSRGGTRTTRLLEGNSRLHLVVTGVSSGWAVKDSPVPTLSMAATWLKIKWDYLSLLVWFSSEFAGNSQRKTYIIFQGSMDHVEGN